MESVKIQQYNGHNLAVSIHDARSKKIVIFCHGYRGTSVGPSRFFVRAARKLAVNNVSSLRFDQYCSGNSDGDFVNSSFNDWVATTAKIVEDYLAKGYEVALLGQSMGGATVICVSSLIADVKATVAWVPDPNVDIFTPPENGIIEEGGQLVQASFWQEAHNTKVTGKLANAETPMYIVQCSEDEYVSPVNHQAIVENSQPHHKVEMFKGYKHSSWTYEQSENIINKSVDFIIKSFER